MNPRNYILYLFLSGALQIGCQSSTTSPVDPGTDYFPLETGRYTVYSVTEQQYGLNAVPVQRTYQIKEEIGASYQDVTGQPAFKLLRYRRAADNLPWQADSIWSIRQVNNEAIRTENGQDFVKLQFPISDNLTWNGNQLNALGEDAYLMRNTNQPYHVSDKEYDETVTVVAQDDSTLVSQDKRIEVYARQIGLIYKERVQLQFCSSSPSCIGTYQIDYGIRQVYRIQAYGKE
ncbi:hypothetical protein WBJ53_14400 [Spirosoma sp. SC4-14]|uniref:hypothetical protein n=1 Tax=Spirosoma sp. SC4-14 TaxID=3128900 RepID=UPI0030D163B7